MARGTLVTCAGCEPKAVLSSATWKAALATTPRTQSDGGRRVLMNA